MKIKISNPFYYIREIFKEDIADMSIAKVVSLYLSFIMVLLVLSGLVGAVLWVYIINTWAIYLGKAVTFGVGSGFVLGMIPGIGQLSLPIAAITYLAFLLIL